MTSDKKISTEAIKDAGKKASGKISEKLETAKIKSKEMMADKKFKKKAAIGAAAAIGSAAIAAALLYTNKRSKEKNKPADTSKVQETD